MAIFHVWRWQVGNSQIMSRHVMSHAFAKLKNHVTPIGLVAGVLSLLGPLSQEGTWGGVCIFCVAQVGNTGVWAPYYYSEDQGTILSECFS